MTYEEVKKTLEEYGYTEEELREGEHVFYKFGKTDFLYASNAVKFHVYLDGEELTKVTMVKYTQAYGGQYTDIKDIDKLEDLKFYM